MNTVKTLLLALCFSAACGESDKPPPPIEVVPLEEDPCEAFRSTVVPVPDPPVECPEESDSSSGTDSGSESDSSSTGEPPPTCEEFHACVSGCLLLDADWAFGEQARQECADSCEVPPDFDLAREWGTACAKQDLETCEDCAKTCEAGLAACLYFEG